MNISHFWAILILALSGCQQSGNWTYGFIGDVSNSKRPGSPKIFVNTDAFLIPSPTIIRDDLLVWAVALRADSGVMILACDNPSKSPASWNVSTSENTLRAWFVVFPDDFGNRSSMPLRQFYERENIAVAPLANGSDSLGKGFKIVSLQGAVHVELGIHGFHRLDVDLFTLELPDSLAPNAIQQRSRVNGRFVRYWLPAHSIP